MGNTLPSVNLSIALTYYSIMTVNPAFVITANAVGLVQLQVNMVADIPFTYNINNLQFTYPSNDPPATVDVSAPDGRE